MTEQEPRRVYDALIEVLQKAIEYSEKPEEEYVNFDKWLEEKSTAQLEQLAYVSDAMAEMLGDVIERKESKGCKHPFMKRVESVTGDPLKPKYQCKSCGEILVEDLTK